MYGSMFSRIKSSLNALSATIAQRAQYAEPKMRALGILGFAGFPTYYVCWTYWFPQPYENLALRLFFAATFLPLALVRYWPLAWRVYIPTYWYVTVTAALPGFFTYMTLRNGMNHAWQMSSLICMFLLALIFDVWSLCFTVVIGVSLAVAVYLLGPQTPPTDDVLMFTSFLIFTVVSGLVFQISREVMEQEKTKALLAISSDIAHELRTPLLSMRAISNGVGKHLPSLIDTYKIALEKGLIESTIRPIHLQSIRRATEALNAEAANANTTIDMLLMNVRPVALREFEKISMLECVDNALQRYPFASNLERAYVKPIMTGDFNFYGSKLLMIHIIFNLLKNAIAHLARKGGGDISITLIAGERRNSLIFRDSGPGISSNDIAHIFERFYSTNTQSETRMGVGLAFCRAAMDSMNGHIECQSERPLYTQFLLHFPRLRQDQT
jgi:two-component system, CAI-1 autoinducer sensor kinase/phosphatase CqsS